MDESHCVVRSAMCVRLGTAANGTSCAVLGTTRVEPGDPASSLLIDKISNAMPECGEPMPPGGALSATEIKQIVDWIQAGAMNN